GGDPHLPARGVEHRLPGAVVPPPLEVGEDGALGREVVRQHVPLAAASGLVEDGVEDLPDLDIPGPSQGRDGDQRLQDGPLRGYPVINSLSDKELRRTARIRLARSSAETKAITCQAGELRFDVTC